MDDLKDRITSTNRDWYDLLADEVKKEIKDAEDPEAEIIRGSLMMPDLSFMTKYREATEAVETNMDDLKEKADV